MLILLQSTFSANISGELVIPESLKMLPVYALGIVKSPVLRVAIGERVDRRVHLLSSLGHMPWSRVVVFAYGRLYSMHAETPLKLSLSSVMEAGGVVLLDTAFELIVYVARAADPQLLAHVFAVTAFEEVDPQQPLPLVDSPLSQRLHELIASIRARSATWARLSVVREGDPRTVEFMQCLIEDRTNQPPLPSFQEFVRQLQGIGSKLKN